MPRSDPTTRAGTDADDGGPTDPRVTDQRLTRLRLVVGIAAVLLRSIARRARRRRRGSPEERALATRRETIAGPPDYLSQPVTTDGVLASPQEPLTTDGLPATIDCDSTLTVRQADDRLVIADPTEPDASLSSTVWVPVER